MTYVLTTLFFASLGISFSAHAQSLEPGLWQAKTSLNLSGLPLPDSDGEECISSADAKDVKSTIAKELKKKGCEITKWTLKSKKLEASLKCDSNDLKAEGKLWGTVTPKSYELSGDAAGSFKSIPASAELKLTGKWIKACTN